MRAARHEPPGRPGDLEGAEGLESGSPGYRSKAVRPDRQAASMRAGVPTGTHRRPDARTRTPTAAPCGAAACICARRTIGAFIGVALRPRLERARLVKEEKAFPPPTGGDGGRFRAQSQRGASDRGVRRMVADPARFGTLCRSAASIGLPTRYIGAECAGTREDDGRNCNGVGAPTDLFRAGDDPG